MLSERKIINALILITGMILGPYLIVLTLEYNQVPLLVFAGLVYIFFIFFVLKDRVVALPLLGAYFHGKLNFLPFGVTPVEVLSLTSILYYVINYVCLKRRPIDLGPPHFIIPLAIILGIVLYHDHDIGLHVLGSSSQGSRPGLDILLAIVTYFCGINTPCPSIPFLSRLPWYCFGLTCFGTVPYILTTYFPSLAPYVYYISGNVNFDAYLESVGTTDSDSVGRNGGLLALGGTLQVVLISYFPLMTWWHPRRWFLIGLSGVCLYGALSGGYRSGLTNFVLTTAVGAICYGRWRAIVLSPLIFIIPICLITIQDYHPAGLSLPTTVQRTLSFLPGNWDWAATENADSSNEFRNDIYRIYRKEYLWKSPWIGNGFTFDAKEAEQLTAMGSTPGISDPGYFSIKAFIVSKNFHIGWISVFDAVGIIGSAAFFILDLAMILTAYFMVFNPKTSLSSPLFPLKVWSFTNLFTGAIGYLTLFGSFVDALVGTCSFAIIIVHLSRIEHQEETKRILPAASSVPGTPTLALPR